ncbi:MAG: decaprenyl-phosphate phosphoribosyltransferase [Lachnospiraceae bacterium]|nr:decaprenyl-phosphate phosphoribosyltransferase [Lachnospiraceae bacterium]MCI8772245.1 decaprenyl-phosphate phosphoribosyltransferase [Lachnospiraceae bacterium]
MKHYLKLMRVHHYIKNLLVFAALGCSGQFFHLEKLSDGIAAFTAFCMVSSVVYIINDIQDKEKDRNHPVKCSRPIASEAISIKNACILAMILLIIAAVCNYLTFHVTSTSLLILYLILNLAYSFGLKNIPIADVTILAAGFLIRILYGAISTDIVISNWLYLTVTVLAFYFALGKRRNELQQISSGETRQVLKSYPVHFLDKSMGMCLTLANAFYALWSMDEKTVSFYHNKYLIFTVPIVLLITLKYSLDIEGDSDGDPVEVLIHDKVLLTLCILYLTAMFTILYL